MLLAIESSCDETSVALVTDTDVLSNVVSSQTVHGKYGGVIPELASRAHIENISLVVQEALDVAGVTIHDVQAVACTTHPGLAGALLVGSSFAKGLALKYNIPCVPVNHIEGHLYSGYLEDVELTFPSVVLVVSGGHTSLFLVRSFNDYQILGSTRDDAAGEAFDKTAKLLGLGYPGGPLIDKLAQKGNATSVEFPRPFKFSGDYEFSFSGLKTSVRTHLQKKYNFEIPEEDIPNLCASVQSAIVDVLSYKALNAVKEFKANGLVIAGGVAANSALRSTLKSGVEAINEWRMSKGFSQVNFVAPRMDYCIDNAAMIGFVAVKKLAENPHGYSSLSFQVHSNALRQSKK
jgi:N6-L-threonylcarbamoyladenine synthase